MKTTIQDIEGKLVAILEGELDTAAAVATESELQPVMNCTDRDVELDCSRLTYISSSGLRLFLAINKKCKAAGHSVTLSGLSDDLLKVFKMTGFNNLFVIQ